MAILVTLNGLYLSLLPFPSAPTSMFCMAGVTPLIEVDLAPLSYESVSWFCDEPNQRAGRPEVLL